MLSCRLRWSAPVVRLRWTNPSSSSAVGPSSEFRQQSLRLLLRQPASNHRLRQFPFGGKLVAHFILTTSARSRNSRSLASSHRLGSVRSCLSCLLVLISPFYEHRPYRTATAETRVLEDKTLIGAMVEIDANVEAFHVIDELGWDCRAAEVAKVGCDFHG